jgi:hypothetical protein
MASRKDLEPSIISEWMKRPPNKRQTHEDVLMFYGDLSRDHSHLLSFPDTGDRYQTLKSILKNYMESPSG